MQHVVKIPRGERPSHLGTLGKLFPLPGDEKARGVGGPCTPPAFARAQGSSRQPELGCQEDHRRGTGIVRLVYRELNSV